MRISIAHELPWPWPSRYFVVLLIKTPRCDTCPQNNCWRNRSSVSKFELIMHRVNALITSYSGQLYCLSKPWKSVTVDINGSCQQNAVFVSGMCQCHDNQLLWSVMEFANVMIIMFYVMIMIKSGNLWYQSMLW